MAFLRHTLSRGFPAIFFIFLLTVGGLKLLYLARAFSFVGGSMPLLSTLWLIGIPLICLRGKKRPVDFLPANVYGAGWSVVIGLSALAIILPFLLVGNHFYQGIVWGRRFHPAAFPNWDVALLTQVVWVAIPEEFFYRGFLQSALNDLWKARWRLGGALVGWGWVVAALFFALSHTLILFQWWHIFIIFPALIFGWLREFSKGILAPVVFHTGANLAVHWIGLHYLNSAV